jgi:hypothetical protein
MARKPEDRPEVSQEPYLCTIASHVAVLDVCLLRVLKCALARPDRPRVSAAYTREVWEAPPSEFRMQELGRRAGTCLNTTGTKKD